MKTGAKVLITKDIRDAGTASGQVGIYEGDFPLTVVFGYGASKDADVVWVDGEFMYEDYKKATAVIEAVTTKDGVVHELKEPKPINEVFVEWVRGQARPVPFFAMSFHNPRIRLPDGSVIWGAECWWEEYTDGLTLDDSQKHLEGHLEMLRGIVDAISERQEPDEDV